MKTCTLLFNQEDRQLFRVETLTFVCLSESDPRANTGAEEHLRAARRDMTREIWSFKNVKKGFGWIASGTGKA